VQFLYFLLGVDQLHLLLEAEQQGLVLGLVVPLLLLLAHPGQQAGLLPLPDLLIEQGLKIVLFVGVDGMPLLLGHRRPPALPEHPLLQGFEVLLLGRGHCLQDPVLVLSYLQLVFAVLRHLL
jgi:hypothetical protein